MCKTTIETAKGSNLLSDVLITMGANSNPKNNLSMATANKEMLAHCKLGYGKGINPVLVKNPAVASLS